MALEITEKRKVRIFVEQKQKQKIVPPQVNLENTKRLENLGIFWAKLDFSAEHVTDLWQSLYIQVL